MHKLTSVKNPQANAILECIRTVFINMLCTSELDMTKLVKASDIDVFLSDAAWAIHSTYHTVLKAWPFWWPWWCAGMILRASPNRVGPGLQRKPLVNATGRVLRAIVGNRTKKRQFFQVFSSSTRWKGAQGDVKAPNNNRGMTYQSNRKQSRKKIWYLVGEDDTANDV